MTDDRRPAHDPTRALDGVQPPDQWDDITARAAGAGPSDLTPVATSSLTRRPFLFAAAAVLAVLAIATGLVLTQRDDGSDQVVAGPSSLNGSDDPSEAFGRRWVLTQLQRNGETLDLHAAGRSPTLVLDLTVDGEASFRRCSGGPAPLRLEGDRLVVGDEQRSTTMPCVGTEGEAVMAVDDAMSALLADRPIVELSGDRLLLRSDTAEAHFREAMGQPIHTDGDGDGTDAEPEGEVVVVPSGDSTCAIGLDSSVYPELSWSLGPGPADPPVLESEWGVTRQGVWNLGRDGQRVEVHVPGLIVRDLVGARTEEVLLAENWSAIAWFTNGWVQIRNFAGGTDGSPCSTFTVTVTGSTEDENRDTALGIASSIVVAEWPSAAGSSEPSAPPSGEDTEPTIPSADDGEDVDLRGWYGNTGPMVLATVEVDGVVTPAVHTPFGGDRSDADGGPIALVARVDEGRLELRGCEIEFLSLRESEGRPNVQLLPGQSSNEGCSPAAGEQWGQVLKILSLGPVTRMVPTDDGPMLVLATDDGTAVFRHP